jgi:hypothetical protein
MTVGGCCSLQQIFLLTVVARVYRDDKCGRLSFSDHGKKDDGLFVFWVKARNTDAGFAVYMAVAQREMALAFYF